MKPKAEYKSAIRSRKLIRNALLTMLETKELSKITVTDLVRTADINRSTFYAHYQNILDITTEIENEIIEKMLLILRGFHYQDFFVNPTPLLSQLSTILEEDLDYYQKLILSNGSEQFLEKLKQIFADYMKNDSAIPVEIRNTTSFLLHVSFFSGGIVTMYQQWFQGKFDCSLQDISNELSQMILSAATDLCSTISS